MQPQIDLTAKEIREYSLVRGLRTLAFGGEMGIEGEVSRAIAAFRLSSGVSADPRRKLYVPTGQQLFTRAPYAVGATGTGGALVATELLAESFIDVLRNYAAVLRLGATMLTGLVGKVDIPRQSAQGTAYWVGESSAVTEAEATFDKITLSPKTIGTLSKQSRLTLLQTTPAIEMLVRNDMARVMGLGIDLAALSGSGSSNQPTGIANVSGIGSVVGGTNGASILVDHLIGLEAQLTIANAPMNALAFLGNAKTIGTLKLLKSSTGQYLWSPSPYGGVTQSPMAGARTGEIIGYPIVLSNQARSALTKGTASGSCSELFFGNWSELIIGEWGSLEIMVNPYDSTGFTTGDVLIRALQTIDIEVRHAASFAVMSDALTSY